VNALRERLAARLAAALAAHGPARAIPVCAREASSLADAVTQETGVEVGRAPARPRGDAGAPSWARAHVKEAAPRRAADVAPVVLDLGDRVALLRPIAVVDACLVCHGGPGRIAPEVSAALTDEDRSRLTGLAEGDIAGFFWAEARK
jgi:hypothetical protein